MTSILPDLTASDERGAVQASRRASMFAIRSALIWLQTLSCLLYTPVSALPVDSNNLDARAAVTLPSDDPFYTPPDGFASARPGAILRTRPVPAPIAAFRLFPIYLASANQILYRTTDSFGNPTATVTTVLVPAGANLNKLISYQVAEDASYLNCAPSYALQQNSDTGGIAGTVVTQIEIIAIVAALQQGWVVAIPDHLGPKATFLANINSGRATLDGIRAALASSSLTGVRPGATITMWGYSGGSLASAMAAEMQGSYAPELRIAGAALGGTVPNILSATSSINRGTAAGLIPAGLLGLSHEYSAVAAALQDYYIPSQRATFVKADTQCLGSNILQFANQDILATYFTNSSFLTSPDITQILNANDLGNHSPSIPLFIYKSIQDKISVVGDTDTLYNQYCARGATVRYQRDVLSDHATLSILGLPSAIIWLRDRMNGIAAQSGCARADVLSSLADPRALAVLGPRLLALLQSFAAKSDLQLYSGT